MLSSDFVGTSHAHGAQTNMKAKNSEGEKENKDPSIGPARGLSCLSSLFVVNNIKSL